MNTQLYKDLINEKEYFDYINKKKDRMINTCKYDSLEKMYKSFIHSYPKTVSKKQEHLVNGSAKSSV